MVSCCAFGCTNRTSKKTPGVTFHSLPKDEKKRLAWIKAIRRQNWKPSEYSKICSDHFEENQIDRTSLSCVRIRDDEVPRIFKSFPQYLQKTKKPRKSPTKRNSSSTSNISLSKELIIEEFPEIDHQLTASDSVEVVLEGSTATVKSPRIGTSPTKEALKRKVQKLETLNSKYIKKIKLLQRQKNRNQHKIADFQSIIDELKENKLVETDSLDILSRACSVNEELLKRQISKVTEQMRPKAYGAELKAFAITLHYYSPKAYNYVREKFLKSLPHCRTISKWYRHVNGMPGFTSEALQMIEMFINASNKSLLFALSFDEMAIHELIEHDGKMFHGYVNYGTNIDDDSLPPAKEALVFMIVAINASFKMPIGYFFISGIGSEQKSNLVIQCLTLLHAINARVVSLTCDGLSTNITMLTTLGSKLSSEAMQSYFLHPVTQEKIAVFLDPSHMLKLVRNVLGDKKNIYHNGNSIDWDYVVKLHELQQSEGLHLGNKLRSAHVNFVKQKMKTKLASQLFSHSVADALLFCENSLKLAQFQGAGNTCIFLQLFNDLFDVLNSFSEKSYGLKKPIEKENSERVISFLVEAKKYISKLALKVKNNYVKVLASPRKTGFLGFLMCIESTILLSEKLVLGEDPILKNLPIYKFSQDHIEMFFQIIRTKSGANNNPTARQFQSAYKKILIRNELKSTGNGNCIPLESISIICFPSTIKPEEQINLSTVGFNSGEVSDLDIGHDSVEEGDHNYLFNIGALSECTEHIVYYIGGFVVRSLTKALKCNPCVVSLYTEVPLLKHSLVAYKDKAGGLIHPSSDVFTICKICESEFRKQASSNLNRMINVCKLEIIVITLLRDRNVFNCLERHMHETSPTANHSCLLMTCIVRKYLKVRYTYWCKMKSNKAESVRNVFTKMILFRGQ